MKFKNNERVKIIKGFYEGEEGVVNRYNTFLLFFVNYDVYIPSASTTRYSVASRHLKSLDKVHKDFYKKLHKSVK